MNNKKIAVLMCTYNGEKYLREQIDSILNQKGIVVDLYIRDDGSSDGTLDILKSYKENIFIVNDRKHKHLGAAIGFMKLLFFVYNKCEAYDYYSFADQDDIWNNDKIMIAVDTIKEKSFPCLYCSNVMHFKDGKEIGLRHKERPDVSFVRHIMGNNIHGCTFVFNHLLAEQIKNGGIPKSNYFRTNYHDSWIILVALAIGRVVYDEKSHLLYRIHDNNEVGIPVKRSLKEKKQKFGVYFPNYHLWKNTAIELNKRYTVNGRNKELLDIICNYDKNIFYRFKMYDLIKNHYTSRKYKLLIKIMCGFV